MQGTVSPLPYADMDESRVNSRAALFSSQSRPTSSISQKPILPQAITLEKIEDQDEKPKKEKKPKKVLTEKQKKMKDLIIFFVTNFGMAIVTTLYCLAGAYLFNILEAQNELAGCQGSQSDSAQMISDYTTKIFNYLSFNVTWNPLLPTGDNTTIIKDGPEVYNTVVLDWLTELKDEISDNGYSGEDCEQVNSWQFLSGVLWTMTVVTSIGYGHTSPSTWEGQIVLLCYTLFGMPLFLMTCAKISVMLANFFVFVYKHIFCCCCNVYSAYKLSTEDDEEEEIEVDEENPETFESEDNISKEPISYQPENRVSSAKKNLDKMDSNSINDEECDEEEEEEEDSTRVPLIIIMGTIIGFIYGGGYLFLYLEEWDVVLGAYFVFISISTVGFGDYSPGTTDIGNGEIAKASRNIIIGTVFIVIGMSILGMCFSLMHEGIVDNLTLLLTTLGCIKEDDEEEDCDEEIIDELENDLDIMKQSEQKKSEAIAGEEFNMNHEYVEDDQGNDGGFEYKEMDEPEIEVERSSSTLIRVKEKTNPDLNETSA